MDPYLRRQAGNELVVGAAANREFGSETLPGQVLVGIAQDADVVLGLLEDSAVQQGEGEDEFHRLGARGAGRKLETLLQVRPGRVAGQILAHPLVGPCRSVGVGPEAVEARRVDARTGGVIPATGGEHDSGGGEQAGSEQEETSLSENVGHDDCNAQRVALARAIATRKLRGFR